MCLYYLGNIYFLKSQQFQWRNITVPLLRTKLWVHFWTRDYDQVNLIVTTYPGVDEKQGESSYRNRLMYMKIDQLRKLVKKLTIEANLDYYNESLLGRAYARLSVAESRETMRIQLLHNAKQHITKALEGAKVKNDLIETAVQSW